MAQDDSKYTKPGLRKRIFNQVKAGSKGGKPGQWSARKAQLVAQKYKAAGGGYKGGKGKKQKDLKRWGKEKWKDQHGRACGSSKSKGTVKCRPAKKVSKSTPKTWKQVGKNKKRLVAEKKRVGMGRRTKKA